MKPRSARCSSLAARSRAAEGRRGVPPPPAPPPVPSSSPPQSSAADRSLGSPARSAGACAVTSPRAARSRRARSVQQSGSSSGTTSRSSTVAVVVPYGSALEPAEQGGLAFAAADMLDEGAGDRDALAFSQAVNDLGAKLASSADRDASVVAHRGARRQARAGARSDGRRRHAPARTMRRIGRGCRRLGQRAEKSRARAERGRARRHLGALRRRPPLRPPAGGHPHLGAARRLERHRRLAKAHLEARRGNVRRRGRRDSRQGSRSFSEKLSPAGSRRARCPCLLRSSLTSCGKRRAHVRGRSRRRAADRDVARELGPTRERSLLRAARHAQHRRSVGRSLRASTRTCAKITAGPTARVRASTRSEGRACSSSEPPSRRTRLLRRSGKRGKKSSAWPRTGSPMRKSTSSGRS